MTLALTEHTVCNMLSNEILTGNLHFIVTLWWLVSCFWIVINDLKILQGGNIGLDILICSVNNKYTELFFFIFKKYSRTSQAQCSCVRNIIYFHRAVVHLQFTITRMFHSDLNCFAGLFKLGIDYLVDTDMMS